MPLYGCCTAYILMEGTEISIFCAMLHNIKFVFYSFNISP